MSIGEKRGWIFSPPGSSSGSGISLSTPCPQGFLCWSTLRTTGHRSSQWCAGRQGTEMRKAQATPHCHFHSPPHHQLVHPTPWKQWLVCKRSLACVLPEWVTKSGQQGCRSKHSDMWGSSVQLGNRKKLSESDLSGCSVSYPSRLMLQRLLIRPQKVWGQTTLPALFQLLFNCSIVSDSLWPNGLQHARLPCPSPSLRACSNMSIELVILSNHLILCCPLLLLPSIFPSMRVFSNESALHIRWPKYWSFSFSISSSNE